MAAAEEVVAELLLVELALMAHLPSLELELVEAAVEEEAVPIPNLEVVLVVSVEVEVVELVAPSVVEVEVGLELSVGQAGEDDTEVFDVEHLGMVWVLEWQHNLACPAVETLSDSQGFHHS